MAQLPAVLPSRKTMLQFKGLKDKHKQYNVTWNHLVEAFNVNIFDGTLVRRDGYTTLLNLTAAHSLYADRFGCFFVDNGVLYKTTDFLTSTAIYTLGHNNAVEYATGVDSTFFTDGSVLRLINGITGTVTSIIDDSRTPYKVPLPAGSRLLYHMGVLYSVVGSVVYFTDAYSLNMDTRRCMLPFPTTVQMIGGLETGLYISDENYTYFFSTTDPTADGAKLSVTLPYPAFKQTPLEVKADYFGNPKEGHLGDYLVFCTKNGFAFGTEDGEALPVTKEDVVFPSTCDSVKTAFVEKDGYYKLIANFINAGVGFNGASNTLAVPTAVPAPSTTTTTALPELLSGALVSVNFSNALVWHFTPLQSCTLNALGGHAGDTATLVVTTEGTDGFTLTFGDGFVRNPSTLPTNDGVVVTFTFVFDGTTWNQTASTETF